jgi:hypothetical protein
MQQAARDAGGYLRAADAIQQFGHQQSREEGVKTQEPRP